VDRARQKLEDGDLVIVVLDASQALSDDDRAIVDLARARRCLVVLNKVDLPRAVSIAEVRNRLATNVPVVEASARTGLGCSDVAAALRTAVHPVGSDQTAPSVSRLRHRTALEQSQARVRSALGVLRNDGPAELVSVELRDALSELAAITDPVDNEDVLDRIFAEFCIGK
jgi:tRNA modification GTPase